MLPTLGSDWVPGLAFLAPGRRWEGSLRGRLHGPSGVAEAGGVAGDVAGSCSVSGPWVLFGGGRRLSCQECGICGGPWLWCPWRL